MPQNTKQLTLKRLAIDTYKENVAYLHRDCALYRTEGFQALSKLEVRNGKRRILAVLNVVDDDAIVGTNEIGLSEQAFAQMGQKEGTLVSIAHAEPPVSMEAVRRKLRGERLAAEDYIAITRDIADNRYSKVEMAAFVVTSGQTGLDRDEVLLDIGYKSEGVIPTKELSIRHDVDPDQVVKVGDEVEALVLQKEDKEGRLILSKKRAQYERAWGRIEEVMQSGGTIKGPVIEVVKGGLIVSIGVDSFLPASHIDIQPPKNLDQYLGQTYDFKVLKINLDRKNIVLSRRELIEEQRAAKRRELLEKIAPGQIRRGVVKKTELSQYENVRSNGIIAILLEDITARDVERSAGKILAILAAPLQLAGRDWYIGASIGISLTPRDGTDISTLLKHADTAMYRAKGDGRHRFCFFDEGMAEQAALQVACETALHLAVERKSFILHYQPQIDMASGRIVGVEALLALGLGALALRADVHHREAGLLGQREGAGVEGVGQLLVVLGDDAGAAAVGAVQFDQLDAEPLGDQRHRAVQLRGEAPGYAPGPVGQFHSASSACSPTM